MLLTIIVRRLKDRTYKMGQLNPDNGVKQSLNKFKKKLSSVGFERTMQIKLQISARANNAMHVNMKIFPT